MGGFTPLVVCSMDYPGTGVYILRILCIFSAETYDEMLSTSIPQTPGPERDFYLSLRKEFTSLVKKVLCKPASNSLCLFM